jgi:hypothetical protein
MVKERRGLRLWFLAYSLMAYDYNPRHTMQLKLRLVQRHATAPLQSSKLGKDGQTLVNICRVIQLCIDQLDSTRVPELRTLRLMFKALMASISASVKSNEVLSKLGRSLSESFVLGMTAMPRCVAQRRRTWAGSAHIFSCCHTLCEVRQTFIMGLPSLDDGILYK